MRSAAAHARASISTRRFTARSVVDPVQISVSSTPKRSGRVLAAEFAQVAVSHGMRLKVCSQKAFLIPGVVEEARCVDADRLERVAGHPLEEKPRQRGNRKECGCFASKDIGEYDTCPHGCVYCYARP